MLSGWPRKRQYGMLAEFAYRASRQTAVEADDSLESIQKLHHHPLYSMRYEGDYEIDPERLWRTGDLTEGGPDWGCSLFYHYQLGDPVFGRNFDWASQPALLLFTNPPGRFASVSMVDTSYLGFKAKQFDAGKSATAAQCLLEATQIPLDGMNEHGLTVGIAVVPVMPVMDDPKIPDAHALHLVHLVLDTARNVAEAKAIFQKYDIIFTGAPHVHFLLGDRKGQSMVVEIKDGHTSYLHNDATAANAPQWQTATNFCLDGQANPTSQCWRFAKIERTFGEPQEEADSPMDVLKSVADGGTQWSAVYLPAAGQVTIAMGRDYRNPLVFQVRQSDGAGIAK